MNHYNTLGVSRNASPKEIKKAFHALALVHHPDKPGSSEEEWRRFNEAYEALKDPHRRREYNASLDFDPRLADSFESLGLTLVNHIIINAILKNLLLIALNITLLVTFWGVWSIFLASATSYTIYRGTRRALRAPNGRNRAAWSVMMRRLKS